MVIGEALLLLFGIVFVIILGITYLPSLVGNKADEVRELKRKLISERESNKVATKALRAIANGSANPILEAGIALDEIENNENKELTS